MILRRAATGLTLALCLLSTILSAWLGHLLPSHQPLPSLNQMMEDWRWQWPMKPTPEVPIVIIDIDDESIQRFGRWPWPRELTATLLEKLWFEAKPRALAIDILLPEPSPLHAADKRLARLGNAGIIFAQTFGTGNAATSLRQGQLLSGQDCPPTMTWPATSAYIGLSPSIMSNPMVLRAGHVTPQFDTDGLLRRYLPLVRFGTSCYPALALAVYQAMTSESKPAWHIESSGNEPLLVSESGGSLPVQPDGTVTLNWQGPHFRRIPAYRVLQDEAAAVPPHSVLLVGSTAAGLGDLISTPTNPRYPGVEVHATALRDLLLDRHIVRPFWAVPATWLCCFLLSSLLALLSLRQEIRHLIAGAILGALLWTVLAAVAWYHAIDLPFLAIWWLVILLLPLLLLMLSIQARRQARQIYQLFSSYVPKEMLAELVRSGADPRQLEAEQREITVMFADLRGFTRLSEPLSPSQVATLLHNVMSHLSHIIGAHRGTLDKFMGDGLMAFWGAPLPDAGHADHAVNCAIDIIASLPRLNASLQALDLPPVQIGIGINSGLAAVGNMGSTERRAYTAVGDTVNLASRIETLTGELDELVLVGENTCRAATACQAFAHAGFFKVKGREGTVRVFKPIVELPPNRGGIALPPAQGRLWN